MRTRTPLAGSEGWKRRVQFGAANTASSRVCPTLRRSTSNAATTSTSDGFRPPISSCMSPASAAAFRAR